MSKVTKTAETTTDDKSAKQTTGISVLLPKLARNWPYASTVLAFGCKQAEPEELAEPVTNIHKQPIELTRFMPGAKTNPELPERVCIIQSLDYLNTCKDLQSALAELAKIDFDCCVLTIDEGNGTGKHRKTRGYQRNEPTSAYIEAIQRNFHKYDVSLHREDKAIVIIKGRKYYELDC